MPRRPGTTVGQAPPSPPRPRQQEYEETVETKTTNSVGYPDFSDEVRRNFRSDWKLKHVVTAVVPMPPLYAVHYTAVWERTSRRPLG